nr:MAG: major capsid protein [Microvirus sp.]
MSVSFSQIEDSKIPRARFDLSHEVKTTLNQGELVPFYASEVLPGDKFKLSAEVFMRLMPLRSPAMQRMDVYTHFWFVPNRLVWDNWQEFITLGPDGLSAPVHPYVSLSTLYNFGYLGVGSIADYFGIPNVDADIKINVLPFRAYQLIYNEFYRDQNLCVEIPVNKKDGLDDMEDLFLIRKRAWRHDYFTSCLPFAQKGAPVSLPLGTSAPVIYASKGLVNTGLFRYGLPPEDNEMPYGRLYLTGSDNNSSNVFIEDDSLTPPFGNLNYDPNGTLSVDLSNATAATVADLRQAFQLQRFLERNARGGSRYIEALYHQFKVISSDARLQRPEYLGGGKSPVVISEVLQTSETTENNALGTLGGRGVSVGNSNNFKRYFEEHGWIIGIMSIMPKSSYMQGLHRQFSRFEALDYAFPVFAHLGEQEVLLKEIYVSSNDQENDEVFGYQERYAEYRFKPDVITGEFKTTLDFWHQGRIFSAKPALNQCIKSELYRMFSPL